MQFAVTNSITRKGTVKGLDTVGKRSTQGSRTIASVNLSLPYGVRLTEIASLLRASLVAALLAKRGDFMFRNLLKPTLSRAHSLGYSQLIKGKRCDLLCCLIFVYIDSIFENNTTVLKLGMFFNVIFNYFIY